jgi:lysophospholipase L1-like esterase
MLAGLLSLGIAEGAGVWLAFLAIFLGPMIAVTTLLQAEAAVTGRPSRSRESIIKLALLLGSVLGSFILIEAYLRWNSANLDEAAPSPTETEEEWFLLPERIVRLAALRARHLTLPDAWSRRSTTVEGASLAYTWHGALHVYDKEGFRRINGPFPPKDPETFRIMVVGDSLTYGIGIATEWTYSNLLERSLKDSYRTEVFNLGHSGYQSEDILGVLHRFMPRLDPDLVVYAVCLNDFLPSGQHVYDAAYAFPLPEEWKTYLLDRTHLARLFTDVYSALLLALDLKADFFEDILAGGKNYQERFARDVAAMNRLVKDKGVPSIVGIVFHQNPGGDQRGWELVEIAERGLEDAGFDLVSIKHWRERFKSRTFPVSRWEGHPNELANAAFAEELHKHILERGYLQGYRTSN